MPGYKVHDATTVGLALSWIAFSVFVPTPHALYVTIGILFGGLLWNGDLDTNSAIYKRWLILKFYWYPYKKVIPHRHFTSHLPILGTILRYCYTLPLALLVCHIFELDYEILISIQCLMILVGADLSQALHSSLDWTIKN